MPFQKGKPIQESDRIKVEITPNEVILTNKCAEVGDEGDYSINLVNEKGQDTCNVKINVKGQLVFDPQA